VDVCEVIVMRCLCECVCACVGVFCVAHVTFTTTPQKIVNLYTLSTAFGFEQALKRFFSSGTNLICSQRVFGKENKCIFSNTHVTCHCLLGVSLRI